MNTQWLTVEEVAALLNISEQMARKNAFHGKYGETMYEKSTNGGQGGKIIKINLLSLPLNAQVAYLKSHGQEFQIEQIEIPDSDAWEKAPDWKRQVAAERMAILASWDKFLAAHPEGNKTDLTKEFIDTWLVKNDQNKLSFQTLYRWRKDYRDGGRCALLPGWGDTKRERAIDPKAFQFFCKIYNTLQQRTIADCYADMVLVAEEKGWRVPSLRTLQRIVQEDMPESTKILFREGEEAFRNKCQPYILRDPESIRGNQFWIGDHHQFDLFCVGPNGKPVRPWITAWIDFRSWLLVGWNINYGPNTDTIMAAFAEGALNDFIGLPNSDIGIDNGRDYSSYEFAGRGNRKVKIKIDENTVRSLVSELGIVPHFAIPKNARSKTIERFFEIVAEKFSKRFPTYCGSNTEERPEGLEDLLKNHPEKIPTLQEIQQAFKDWVTYVYHQTPSEGAGRKGETPLETFQRTRGPLRIAPEAALRLCLMRHSQALTVQRNGVKLFNQWYFHDELVALHLGEQVYLRYRDADMTKVFVFTIKGEYLCEAAIKNLLPALGANKEDIRNANHESKRVKRITKEFYQISEEIEAEPDHLARVISRKKAAAPPDPEPPKVVEPVRVSKQLNEASKAIYKSIMESERQIAVGGGYAQTYEQRREAERERIRESMEAVRRSMSMSKNK